jgi:hypothetical protein
MNSNELQGALDAVKQGENGVIVNATIVSDLKQPDFRWIYLE